MWGDFDGPACAAQLRAIEIHLAIAKAAHPFHIPRAATQLRPNPSPQFTDAKRLRDVIVGTGVEPEFFLRLLRPGGQHDYRSRDARAAETGANVETVHFGEHEI